MSDVHASPRRSNSPCGLESVRICEPLERLETNEENLMVFELGFCQKKIGIFSLIQIGLSQTGQISNSKGEFGLCGDA